MSAHRDDKTLGRQLVRVRSHSIDRWWPVRRLNDDQGSVVLEAVLVIPVLMILLLIIMQFVLWAHAAQVVQLAASEGDRTARSSNGSIIQGIDRARDVLNASDSNVSSSNVSIRVLSADLVETTVTGNVQSILPGMSFSVSATQVGPIQEFRSGE